MKLSRPLRKLQAAPVRYTAGTKLKTRRRTRYILYAAILVMIAGGSYLLALNLSPKPISAKHIKSSIDLDVTDDVSDTRDRIQIAKINLEVPFYTGNSPKTLERGAWYRYPERGSPKAGGNFVLSAHRFELGSTPQHTKEKSPFYNVHKLSVGDEVKAYFDAQWYTYRIRKIYSVKPDQISVEAPSDTAKLTLYTCSLKGAADGRVVLEATLSNP